MPPRFDVFIWSMAYRVSNVTRPNTKFEPLIFDEPSSVYSIDHPIQFSQLPEAPGSGFFLSSSPHRHTK